MSLLHVGTTAPTFTLPDHTNTPINLADFSGKWRVIYFYPKASTPGCTTQACSIRDNIDDFNALGVPVFGISPDSPKAIAKFVTNQNLNFHLLGDESKETLEKYGVWAEKSMYGKTYMGALRVTYIIDPQGKIAHVMPKVSPATHTAEVLAFLKENMNK